MADLTKLQRSLGMKFRDQGLLRKALTHGSYIHENPDVAQESNQRLEFLGDAVLGHVVAQELYQRYPSLDEGQLTEARAQMVRTETLSAVAHRLGLGGYLYFGKGEEGSGGESKPRNLAGALEALIGAILLDQGMEAARRFILEQLEEEMERAGASWQVKDYKSQLQQLSQARWKVQPTYTTEEEEKPPDTRIFVAHALVDGRTLGRGTGLSKQAAQMEAARDALETMAALEGTEEA